MAEFVKLGISQNHSVLSWILQLPLSSLLLPKYQLSTLSLLSLGEKDLNECNYNVVSFNRIVFPLISKLLFKYKSK